MKDKLVKLDPDLLFADGYDDCIIGLAFRDETPVVLYSASAVKNKIADNMPYPDAEDYFYFNVAGSYVGERTPLFFEDDLNE